MRIPFKSRPLTEESLKILLPKSSYPNIGSTWACRWIRWLGAPQPARFTCAAPDITHLVVFNHRHPVNRGGSCDLYLGLHKATGRVALKFVRFRHPPEVMNHLIVKEINMWYDCIHQNILPLLGVVWKDGDVYMVAKWADNGTLFEYATSHPEADKVELLRGVASGILYLHDRGIIHGDIKAANVVVDAYGVAMLIDFGLSKPGSTLTSTPLAGAGSLRWTAPELIDGKSKERSSDVYAFSIAVYEVLSGRLPYAEVESDLAIIRAVSNGVRPPTEPAESTDGYCYRSIWKIVTAAWAADPKCRPTMQNILAMLHAIPLRSHTVTYFQRYPEFHSVPSPSHSTKNTPEAPRITEMIIKNYRSSIRFAPPSPSSDVLSKNPESSYSGPAELTVLSSREFKGNEDSKEAFVDTAPMGPEVTDHLKGLRAEEVYETLLSVALSEGESPGKAIPICCLSRIDNFLRGYPLYSILSRLIFVWQ